MQLAVWLAAVAVLAGCGKRRDDEPGASPARGSDAPRALRAVAELRGHATLVASGRRIAVWLAGSGGAASGGPESEPVMRVDGGTWYEPTDGGALVARPDLGTALARSRAELGGELIDLHLGRLPILAGGPDHREQVLRFDPAPRRVEVSGMVVQVIATPAAELWRIEHELRSELASIDASGSPNLLPALALVGPPVAGSSPVSAKACAAPKVRELAAGGDAIIALITECAPESPVRIATYRWPGPSVTITTLPPLDELGLQIDRLVATRAAAPVLVGRRGDSLAIARVGADGKLAIATGGSGIDAIAGAAVADDGAVWTLAIRRAQGGRDAREIARDGAVVRVTGPAGAEVRAESLALDERLGIVVLGWENAAHWLFAEHSN